MQTLRDRRAQGKAGLVVVLMALCFGVVGMYAPKAEAAGPYGPDSCLWGYVWREARPTDRVCVTPASRDLAAQENRLAPSRRSPNGGAYGPDTCLQGFVWREAFAGDRVCVTPARWQAVQAENAAGPSRRARDTFRATNSLRAGDVSASINLDLNPNGSYSFRGRVVNNERVARDATVVCVVPLLDGNALSFSWRRSVPGTWGVVAGRDNVRSWSEPNPSGQINTRVANDWTKIPRDQAGHCRLSTSLDVGSVLRDIRTGLAIAGTIYSIVA